MAPVAAWCKLACAFVVTLSSSAQAQTKTERTSSLSWVRLEGAESCIATQALARSVEARLGRKVFVSASEADVSVEGHLSRSETPPRWRAVLTIRDAQGALLGTREIDNDAPDCSAFDEALVFVVSVMIDPEAETAAPAPEKPAEPAPEPAPPRVVVKRERVLVPIASEPPEPWRLELGLGASAALGLLPSPSFGVGADAIVDPPKFWGVLLTATYWFRACVEAERAAEGEVLLAYGGAALCPIHWRGGRASFRSCAGALVGSLRSQGLGFDTELSDETLVAYAFVPNRFSVAIARPLQAFGAISLLVPLQKTELSYRAADGTSHVLFDPAPVAIAGAAGLSLAFP